MSLKHGNGDLGEKHGHTAALGSDHSRDGVHDPEAVGGTENILRQDLKGRHMQMIAM
jgi:amino acid permease